MNESEIKKLIQSAIDEAARKAQYSVTRVPMHTHNNNDAPNIPALNVSGFLPLPATDDGVIAPSNLLMIVPFTLTTTVSVGATSATLNSVWTDDTGRYTVFFSNGSQRNVLFTNSSAAITWTGGMTASATASIQVAFPGRTVFWEQVALNGGQTNLGNRASIPSFSLPIISGDTGVDSLPFQGGDAPDGTILLYKGADYWQFWAMFFGTWRGTTMYLSSGEGGELHTGLITENTNGTTNVDVTPNFSCSIIGVYLISKDTTAADITVVNDGNTVCTIAKGTVAGAMVGATSLANTGYTYGDTLEIDSSSAGNAQVFIAYSIP